MPLGVMAEKEIQKADPGARRRALLVLACAAAIGSLLIAGFEYFKGPFQEWLTSDPAETAFRVRWAVCASTFLLVAPLVCAAVYFWRYGAKVLRAQRFPPPGVRVIRDTPVVSGTGALARGYAIQIVAVCQGAGAVALCLLLWRVLDTGGIMTR